ncbi:hypothetical protein TL16_g01172 [Triparma laevis f. inornata]|uniref:Uncharacterized protein n=1 Tax=Triparma laevis f. inornata TaxID=1714386 RepID=A0A9W6ZKG8_9STRA|nr:hypothetical protein TL16_g01172 [Triparma laevis f. inornata]
MTSYVPLNSNEQHSFDKITTSGMTLIQAAAVPNLATAVPVVSQGFAHTNNRFISDLVANTIDRNDPRVSMFFDIAIESRIAETAFKFSLIKYSDPVPGEMSQSSMPSTFSPMRFSEWEGMTVTDQFKIYVNPNSVQWVNLPMLSMERLQAIAIEEVGIHHNRNYRICGGVFLGLIMVIIGGKMMGDQQDEPVDQYDPDTGQWVEHEERFDPVALTFGVLFLMIGFVFMFIRCCTCVFSMYGVSNYTGASLTISDFFRPENIVAAWEVDKAGWNSYRDVAFNKFGEKGFERLWKNIYYEWDRVIKRSGGHKPVVVISKLGIYSTVYGMNFMPVTRSCDNNCRVKAQYNIKTETFKPKANFMYDLLGCREIMKCNDVEMYEHLSGERVMVVPVVYGARTKRERDGVVRAEDFVLPLPRGLTGREIVKLKSEILCLEEVDLAIRESGLLEKVAGIVSEFAGGGA